MARKLLALLITAGFFYLLSPLVFPLIMGGILAILFYPWLRQLRRMSPYLRLNAAILTLAITVMMILPMTAMVFFSAKLGFHQIQLFKASLSTGHGVLDGILEHPKIHTALDWLAARVPMDTQHLKGTVQDWSKGIGTRVAEWLGEMLTHVPGILISVLVVVVSIFFFLVDGERLVLFCRRHSFFSKNHTDELIDTITDMSRSVILASLVSAILQAILAGIACYVTSVPSPNLIALLVFVASFLPIVGSLPITLGVAFHQLAVGNSGIFVILSLIGFLLLAIDNAVRPWFLKGAADLHPFIAFVAAFGGLQMIGFYGIFFGPILAAVFIVLLDILTRAEEESPRAKS